MEIAIFGACVYACHTAHAYGLPDYIATRTATCIAFPFFPITSIKEKITLENEQNLFLKKDRLLFVHFEIYKIIFEYLKKKWNNLNLDAKKRIIEK